MKGRTKTKPTPLSRPSWDHERRWLGAGRARVAGCDEAGRGPLAGPVVAAAVILRCDETIDDLNDSKKLDPEARLELYRQVRRRAVAVSVGMASHAEIDTINILQASLLAMRRAICGLLEPPEQVLVDGNGTVPGLPCPQEAIVDGDALCFSIAAASIVAKVVRDAIMVRLDGIHPGYGFASHKGYSCPEHYQALDRLGPCRIHRTSFAPVRRLLPDPPPLPPAKTRGASAEQLVLFSDELFGSGPSPQTG